jgi:hypothetical protein
MLVRVFSPQTESEVAVVTAMLQAHDIPVFVHNRNFGSLWPGVQISAYNTQGIMVPEECVSEAVGLLEVFRAAHADSPVLPWRARVRVVLEALLCGWFVPGPANRDG